MFSKKVIDNRSKNTRRNISKETKEYIIERDRVCIICEHEYIQTIHHAMYGLKQDLGPNRNNPEYLVGLCDKCHYILHFQGDNDYREQSIEYLKNYYDPSKNTTLPIS